MLICDFKNKVIIFNVKYIKVYLLNNKNIKKGLIIYIL